MAIKYFDELVNRIFTTNKNFITDEGGIAIKLKNKTGAFSIKGSCVTTSKVDDNAFVLQSNEMDTIGFVYESGIADGQDCYVIVSGVAEVLLKDGTSAIRGNWCMAADTDGRVDATQPAPPNQSTLAAHEQHFKEVGHCLESKNAGTNVLCKIVVHFN